MFNYANSIEIVLEQSDNMLRLMNIYQRELKKLIVLHDRVLEEVVCGTRMWRGDWTEAGVEIGGGGVLQAKPVFHGDSQDGNVLRLRQWLNSRQSAVAFNFPSCVYFQKRLFLSLSLSPEAAAHLV